MRKKAVFFFFLPYRSDKKHIFVSANLIKTVNMKKFLVWALIVFPFVSACDKDDHNDSPDRDPEGLTLQDIVGEWRLDLKSPNEYVEDVFIINSDSTYSNSVSLASMEGNQYNPYYQYQEEGRLVFENSVLTCDILTAQERFALPPDSFEDAEWEDVSEDMITTSLIVRLLRNGSVMIMDINSPRINQLDGNLPTVYFREGATGLPNDTSELQGTWFCKNGADSLMMAVCFDADSIDFVININSSTAERYTGTYTYTDGIVTMNNPTCYVCRNKDEEEARHAANPFDFKWTAPDPHVDTLSFEKGTVFVFIVDGETAYSNISIISPIYTKQ